MRWTLSVVALFALALLLWLRGPWRAEREPPEPLAGPASAAGVEERRTPGTAALAHPGEREALVADGDPPDPAASPPEELLEVRVVLQGSGRPAPGAEVFLLDRGRADPRLQERLRRARAGIDRELETTGRRALADASGLARFPRPDVTVIAAARMDGSFAIRELLANEPGPLVLELAPDPPLAVRVVAASGDPVAGVPVGLYSAHIARPFVLATTRADGLAELCAREHRGSLVSAAGGACLALALFLREPVAVEVDLEHPPAEPLELVLPATGSVEVILHDERGAPCKVGALLEVELAPRTRAEIGRAAERIGGRTVDVADGRALLEHVGLGLELALEVETDAHTAVHEVVSGPSEPGERVEVCITLGSPLPVLTGRIVDQEFRPVGPTGLTVGLRQASQALPFQLGRCTADEGGAFRHALDPALAGERDARPELWLEFEVRSGKDELCATIPAPPLLRGENPLGDVVLVRMPLVAAGVVLDVEGNAVPGAGIEVLLDAAPWVPFSGRDADLEGRSDARGRFELRKALAADEVGLAVWGEGCAYFGPWIVPVGSSELVVELERAGSMSGSLLLDQGSDWPDLSLVRTGEERIVPQISSRSPAGAGVRFRFDRLPAGLYTLVYGFPWSDVRGEIEGIEVIGGRETVDPRLDPLDLRGLVKRIALTVVDGSGRFVPRVAVGLPVQGAQGFAGYPARTEGEHLLIRAGPLPLRVRLEASGFRPVELDDVDGDRRVVMELGIPVRLLLAGPLPELPAGWTLGASLTLGDSQPLVRQAPLVVFEGAAAELAVSEPGRYALMYFLFQRHAGQELDSRGFGEDPVQGLDIRDDGTEQLFELRPPSADTVRRMHAYIEEKE